MFSVGYICLSMYNSLYRPSWYLWSHAGTSRHYLIYRPTETRLQAPTADTVAPTPSPESVAIIPDTGILKTAAATLIRRAAISRLSDQLEQALSGTERRLAYPRFSVSSRTCGSVWSMQRVNAVDQQNTLPTRNAERDSKVRALMSTVIAR